MSSFLKDCLYGTYGVECRKTCNCKGGICDRETGACLTLRFFAKIASKLKTETQAGKWDILDVVSCACCGKIPYALNYFLFFLSCVFRRRCRLRRSQHSPEHSPAHRQIHRPEAAHPSLTSEDKTEFIQCKCSIITYKWAKIYILLCSQMQTFLQQLVVLVLFWISLVLFWQLHVF